MDLNTGPLDWESGDLTTRPLLQLFVMLLLLNLSMYLFAGNCPSKRILILILTDSVFIHMRHIIYTILDIKSKYEKS